MDLDLNEEQEMLREMVRGVCSSYASLETLRELEDDPVGYPAELWKQMAELDLIGLMLPAAYGGSEMSALEGAVVYTELGRSLAPSPHFVSAVMSAGALLRAGSDEQKTAWLPRIVSGDAIVTTAWLEPGNGFGAKGVQTRAVADGGDHGRDRRGATDRHLGQQPAEREWRREVEARPVGQGAPGHDRDGLHAHPRREQQPARAQVVGDTPGLVEVVALEACGRGEVEGIGQRDRHEEALAQ